MATIATDLANGQIAMVDAARFTMERVAVCTQIFKRLTLDPGEKSKYIPKFTSGGAAVDLTDGIDMTNETALQISGSTFTTSEVGCKVIITKKLRSQLKADAYSAAGVVIGNMMGRKIDTDGVALFSGFGNSVGYASTVLTLGSIAAAVSQLQGQSEPAPSPYVGVFHPYQINAIIDQLVMSAATASPASQNYPDSVQTPLLREHWRGRERLFGVNIYADGNIDATTTPTSTYGAIFSPMALIYLVGWEPENWVEEDKSLRGWEIGIVADYDMVENDDAYGRAILTNGTAPVGG